jgi:hypothetical protein
MAQMTDPTAAMVSFQQAIRSGEVRLQRAALDRDVFVYADKLGDTVRFSYARMNGQTVLAFANFVTVGFRDGLPVWQAGVAVPEAERGNGRAKHNLAAGNVELKHGFSCAVPGAELYVEGVVGLDNVASQHVSAAVISNSPTPITDAVSGLDALHYIRKV